MTECFGVQGEIQTRQGYGNGSARSSDVGREHSFQMARAVTELSNTERRCHVHRFHVL